MTRLGKIARLPHEIREELNIRLRNSEVGKELVKWLNGLPETQAMLAAQFAGRPINEQNLSEWKQGGFEDWLRHQEDCAQARLLTEQARELEKEAGDIRLEDRLAVPLALMLARLMREAEESSDGPEKLRTLLNVARELGQLRRGSNDAERVRLERERWETKQAEVKEEKRLRAEVWAQLKAERPDLFRNDSAIPREIVACLEASERLRRAQKGPNGSQNENLPETRSDESSQIKVNQAKIKSEPGSLR